MADTKVSALTALAAASIDAANDLLNIVDVSAGTAGSKKIAVVDLLTPLGLTTSSSPQFTAIQLGHASDTTIARASAGVVTIEGARILTPYGIVTDSNTAITLAAATHAFKELDCTASGGNITVTINTSHGCSIGDDGYIVQADATRTVTVSASGVTFQPTGSKTTTSQWDMIYWKCVGTNTFLIVGGQIPSTGVANVAKVVPLVFSVFDTGGAVPTGLVRPRVIPVTGTIVEVIATRGSATSGTTTIDISVEDDGTLPEAADTICASDKVSIATTAVTTRKTSFTGWTLPVSRGNLCNVDIEANNDSDWIEVVILIQPSE